MIIAVENEPGSFITRGERVCFIAMNACAERRGCYTHMAPLPATWLQSPNSSKPKIKHRLPPSAGAEGSKERVFKLSLGGAVTILAPEASSGALAW